MRPTASARAAVVSLVLVVLLSSLATAQVPPGLTSIQPLPAVTESDDRFGIGNVYPDPHWLALAQNAGMHWNRWEFRWTSIETRAGHYDWAGSDRVVEASRAARLNVQGILIATPRWAEARGPNSVIPAGLYEPWNSPSNTWGRWVRAIAERYRGRVQAWEIWNEPDYPRGTFGFWFGSKADYYQLLKVAYRAIRSVDPQATVLMAGLMYWGDPGYLEDILTLARHDPEAPANNHFFDAVAWHVYSRPTDVYERIRRSRLLLQTYVGHKQIWVNEGNLPVWSESRLNNYARFPLSGTLEEQAAWVVQWYAYALGAGADRVLMYRMHDSDEPEAWGLARADGSLRPAYVAYQLAARYFSHATSAVRATLGDAEQVAFERPGQRIVAVWNRTPNPITANVGAAAPQALLVAVDGSTRVIVPISGTYHLPLPPATANTGFVPGDYLVGGTPYIIVEDLPASARRIEETDAALAWSGPWTDEAQAAAAGGASRASATPGASVSFAFSGPTVTWYTALAPRGGVARLALDGAPLDEVDLHSPFAVPQFPLTYTDLGPGEHMLTIAVADARHQNAVGGHVAVDAFVADQVRPAPAPPAVVPVTPVAALVAVTPPPTAPTATAAPAAPVPPSGPRVSWLPTPPGGLSPAPTVLLTAVVIASALPTVPLPARPSPTATPTPVPSPSPAPAPTVQPSPTLVPTAAPPAPIYQQAPGVPGVIIMPDSPTPSRGGFISLTSVPGLLPTSAVPTLIVPTPAAAPAVRAPATQ